jgi:hypothetical protein
VLRIEIFVSRCYKIELVNRKLIVVEMLTRAIAMRTTTGSPGLPTTMDDPDAVEEEMLLVVDLDVDERVVVSMRRIDAASIVVALTIWLQPVFDRQRKMQDLTRLLDLRQDPDPVAE